MTAQIDDYKHENSAATHLIGQDWQKLIDMIESRPGDTDVKSFDGGGTGGGGSLRQFSAEENILRTLQDVKRLRQKDMPLFGRCPETDIFYTVVCSSCSMILMPNALKGHYEKRHGGNDNKSHSPSDKQKGESPNQGKAKKLPTLKTEKMDKAKKLKPGPLGSESADEGIKDSKRFDKLKKGKPMMELEYSDRISGSSVPIIATAPLGSAMLTTGAIQRCERGKLKVSRFSSDLQPIVALSPIQLVENESESNDSKDSIKNKQKRDKKKNDRKSDKIYDPDKHCGVINESGKPCVRSILCKVHQVALKRAVSSRTMPYDMLIRILRSQNDEEKIKSDNGSIRLVKAEPGGEKLSSEIEKEISGEENVENSKIWGSEQISIKMEEPPIKRLKIKEEIIDEEVDQNQFTLPSHLEALIDETLKTLKDVDESETITMMPVMPKPEPLIKWDLGEAEPKGKPPPSPPHIFLEDIHWHSSHPKPLATNTFGCRLIGGLMSTCKKLDTLRKHLQSVWTGSASSPPSIRSGFNDVYGSGPAAPPSNSPNVNSKNSFAISKYSKKPNQTKSTKKTIGATTAPAGSVAGQKTASSAAGGLTAGKRKRRSNSNLINSVQNSSSNGASDIISGLLIGNPVPVQRGGSTTVSTLPTGVIPVSSITGNGVPLRLFQGSLPVITSASANQPATFIQLNLCSPK